MLVVLFEVYLRLLRTNAAMATATMITAAAAAIYNVMDGVSLLGGGATEGEAGTDGNAEAGTDGNAETGTDGVEVAGDVGAGETEAEGAAVTPS